MKKKKNFIIIVISHVRITGPTPAHKNHLSQLSHYWMNAENTIPSAGSADECWAVFCSTSIFTPLFILICVCFSHLLLVKLRSVTHPPSCECRSNIGRKAYLLGWQTLWGKAWSVKYLGDFPDWLGYLAGWQWPGWPPNDVGCFAAHRLAGT